MTEIRFYHLERQNLDQTLPALLSKAMQNGHRIVVKTRDEKEAERLAEHLWTFHSGSFLPHGTAKDGHPSDQPVWLTPEDENPNQADVLVLTQGTDSENRDQYTLCCEMLDGQDSESVAAARERWKTFKEKGFEVTYWQQGQKGWEKK